MSYETDILPYLTNPPLTGMPPSRLDIVIWRGCDFTASLCLQHKFEVTHGEDSELIGLTETNNKSQVYATKNVTSLYQSAKMQIRKTWVKQGNQSIDALVSLTTSALYDQTQNPITTIMSGEFVFGYVPTNGASYDTGVIILQIPHKLTRSFNFCEGVYDLECVGKDLDQNGNEIIDKLLYGNVVVLGAL